ncbi:TetR family transcriptional regulator [Streptomyces sp. NPDC057684]|uniref:TetR family transcriptional regulator n=1 Tax=Streptomyces sp. NPDC057684 TaxID=3346211 RepID=UPI00369FE103
MTLSAPVMWLLLRLEVPDPARERVQVARFRAPAIPSRHDSERPARLAQRLCISASPQPATPAGVPRRLLRSRLLENRRRAAAAGNGDGRLNQPYHQHQMGISVPSGQSSSPRYSVGQESIFQAALTCFYRHGYHGTSVRDIAKASGTTAAAMYHYYGSKQDLLVDVIERFMQQSIEVTSTAIAQAKDDPAAQLFAAARSHVLWNASDVVSSFVVNSEIRSLEPDNRRYNIAQRDKLQRLFDAAVERGATEGAFATPWPREASRAVVTMCTAVATWYRSGGKLSPEQIADHYGAMALSLVGARPEVIPT